MQDETNLPMGNLMVMERGVYILSNSTVSESVLKDTEANDPERATVVLKIEFS